MKYIGLMHYFFGIGGLAGAKTYFPGIGEAWSWYLEEILDGGLQAYVDSNDNQLEEAKYFLVQVGRS